LAGRSFDRFTDGMFVRAEAQAEISLTLAQARLANLARAGWLLSASQGAYRAGATDLARADPPGPVRGKSRLVNVHFRDLTADGGYRPPPGNLGGELDQVVLRRVAEATIHTFVNRIAEAIFASGPATETGRRNHG
jgi:hypothetical protein